MAVGGTVGATDLLNGDHGEAFLLDFGASPERLAKQVWPGTLTVVPALALHLMCSSTHSSYNSLPRLTTTWCPLLLVRALLQRDPHYVAMACRAATCNVSSCSDKAWPHLKASWRAQVTSLLQHRQLLQATGIRASARARGWTEEANAKQLLSLVEAAVGKAH